MRFLAPCAALLIACAPEPTPSGDAPEPTVPGADTADTVPSSSPCEILAPVAVGEVVRFENRALWDALAGGELVSATLLVPGDGPAASPASAFVAGEPPGGAGTGEGVPVDVTADVGRWLDGVAPNFGWHVTGADPHAIPALEVCGAEPVPADLYRVAADGWTFERALSGAPFVPAGVNYDHDSASRCPELLEDYWDDWAVVEEDFEEMAALGFNVARIHLQFPKFVSAPDRMDEAALIRLDQLVRMADRRGIALNVTGLGQYRAERVPAWFAALDDDAQRAAEAAFWSAIARRYPDQPAIFSYNLQNEPSIAAGEGVDVVSGAFAPCDPDGNGPEPAYGFSYVHFHFRNVGERWTDWIHARYADEAALAAAWPDYPSAGETWDDVGLVGFTSSAGRAADHAAFKHELAALWTQAMVDAIRAHDADHLITVGTTMAWPLQDRLAVAANEPLYYSSFSPYHLRDLVDFVSIHVYPQPYGAQTNLALSEMLFRASHVGKPVILEETYPWIDYDQLLGFLHRSRGSLSGWYSFYWGSTVDELEARGDLGSALTALWLEMYAGFAVEVQQDGPIARTPADVTAPAPIGALLASQEARLALFDAFVAAAADGEVLDPILEP